MSKRGSLFVETAIVLPLFLLAVLSISILIRITAVEENTMRCFSEEAQKTLKEAYLTQLDLLPGQFDMDFSDPSDSYDSIQQKGKTGISEALVHGALLEFRIQSRLKEETVSLKDASLNRFEYLYSDGEASGLIHCGFKYGVELPLPLDFHRQLQFEQRLLFRGFIGADLVAHQLIIWYFHKFHLLLQGHRSAQGMKLQFYIFVFSKFYMRHLARIYLQRTDNLCSFTHRYASGGHITDEYGILLEAG
jgi:hypothetical protein